MLGPLRTATDVVRHLNNLRVRCAVTLAGPDGAPKAREAGELLFRDYGVSGIAVFNLSRFAEPGDRLLVDLLPQMPEGDCAGFLHARRRRLSADGRPLSREAFLRGMLLSAVARAVLEEAGLAPGAPLAKRDVPALAAALKAFPLEVRGIGDERQCQVRRGGADVAAFDPRTLEARAVPGLHVVGEALDVDAPCGGYNLHWAWASGLLAGWSAAEALAGSFGSSGLRPGEGAPCASVDSDSSGSERGEGAPCSNSIEVQGSSRAADGDPCTSMNCARTPSPRSEPTRRNKRGRA